MVLEPVDPSFDGVPDGFEQNMIPFLFPVDHRPEMQGIVSGIESSTRTSLRRDEDERRRRAMHTLVTNWESAAKSTSRRLVDVLFRGFSPSVEPLKTASFPGRLENLDAGNVSKYLSLIPDCVNVSPGSVLAQFAGRCAEIPRQLPMFKVGGYSVTETVGPLSMLSRVCRTREPVVVWVKDRLKLSHSKHRAGISQRRGRVVLFDRYMNLVFVPAGCGADNWQFIRGHVILLIQRS